MKPQEAAELLSAKAFEAAFADDILNIDILPNRPDCLAHLGVARELCALVGKHFAAPSYEYDVDKHGAISIEVDDIERCPRFSALVLRGVKVGPSPKWLTERLELCGLRSINNVVDVTNYVMLELGQPLHAFDLKKIDKLTIRRAKKGEKVRALDEAQTEYTLTPEMLVVADSSNALSIAGIKGGVGSQISADTTDVLLEAANWQPESIRATSHKLGLRTDASVRFSYGVDPNLTVPALVRAAELLKKSAGGRADAGIIDVYQHPRQPLELILDTEYARSLLGAHIGDAQMRGILESLGFEVADIEGKLLIGVPTRRLDITGQEELIEEIGRVYGYDSIASTAPILPIYTESSWTKEEAEGVAWDEYSFIRERQAIGNLLAGAGYSEVYNYAFLSDELKELFKAENVKELAQPQSAEYKYLNTSLVPRLLLNTRDNLRFFGEIKLFETAHIFDRVGEGRESTRLGLVLAYRTATTDPFYELKGALDLLFERLGITDYYYDDSETTLWDKSAVNSTAPGSRALIRLENGGNIIGFIGAVREKVTEPLKLKGMAAVAELDLRLLVRHAQHEREFAPLPKYPAVVRDVAILVQQGVKIDDILQVVQDADTGHLVEDVDVFDIFLPTGKEKIKAEGDTPEYSKSVAFHIVFRAADRTLRDDEVAKVEQAIKIALQEKIDAQVR